MIGIYAQSSVDFSILLHFVSCCIPFERSLLIFKDVLLISYVHVMPYSSTLVNFA